VDYSSVIDACAKSGEVERAQQWFLKAEEAGIALDEISYNSVINACAKAGQANRASQWLLKAEEAGVALSVISYASAVQACAQAKPRRPDLAQQLFQRMLSKKIRPNKVFTKLLGKAIGAHQLRLLLSKHGINAEELP